MSNPKLTKTAVQIKYWSDDGYKSDMTIKGGGSEMGYITGAPVPPEASLLQGIEELQRLCNLFGFGPAADARIAAVNERMKDWRQKHDQVTNPPL